MKSLNKTLLILSIVSFALVSCEAQVKNAKTQTVKIYGNCGMCEKTIETAANKKSEAKANWDKDTKMAVITYDSVKTTVDDVLKRIANAGYDNEKFTGENTAYFKLPECCQYERKEE
jgi:copper chaperone CopZ